MRGGEGRGEGRGEEKAAFFKSSIATGLQLGQGGSSSPLKGEAFEYRDSLSKKSRLLVYGASSNSALSTCDFGHVISVL